MHSVWKLGKKAHMDFGPKKFCLAIVENITIFAPKIAILPDF